MSKGPTSSLWRGQMWSKTTCSTMQLSSEIAVDSYCWWSSGFIFFAGSTFGQHVTTMARLFIHIVVTKLNRHAYPIHWYVYGLCLWGTSLAVSVLIISDVTKLFKIRIRRMWISTSKIRRIRMRMSLDKVYFVTRNATHWFMSMKWMWQYVVANVNITSTQISTM